MHGAGLCGATSIWALKSAVQSSPDSLEKLGRQRGTVPPVPPAAGNGDRTNSQARLRNPGKIAVALMLEKPRGLIPLKDVDNLALHANTFFFFFLAAN